MKQILLPDTKGYKANLHCHSTDSDGRLTPQALKELYKAHGYSVLAFTDHGCMHNRSALCDDRFIALSGYENHLEPPWVRPAPRSNKNYHVCFYAPRPDTVGMIGITDYYYEFCQTYNERKNRDPQEIRYGFFGGESGGFGVQNLNRLLREAKALGYLAVLNHPHWSHLSFADLEGIEGLLGVEIYNHGGELSGDCESDNVYDMMLLGGQPLYCFAGDDNHNRQFDSFGGYNVLYPEELTYDGVFACLRAGRFYASTGARLCGLTAEDTAVTVGTRDARSIALITDRSAQRRWAETEPLISAMFCVPADAAYFRVVVENTEGKKAFSRAYRREENGLWI